MVGADSGNRRPEVGTSPGSDMMLRPDSSRKVLVEEAPALLDSGRTTVHAQLSRMRSVAGWLGRTRLHALRSPVGNEDLALLALLLGIPEARADCETMSKVCCSRGEGLMGAMGGHYVNLTEG